LFVLNMTSCTSSCLTLVPYTYFRSSLFIDCRNIRNLFLQNYRAIRQTTRCGYSYYHKNHLCGKFILGRTVEACGRNTGAERVQIRFTISDASGAAISAVLSWLSLDVFVNVAPSHRFTRPWILLRTLVVGWTSCS
jgi:hypothetical protein